ncbi:hypothetical protein DFS33DRAFT_1309732 [Desarmillaria ectypa]|nr:hypothetical protein DFS33DRAFT_1309732 [Desarmillaria ectypa]
MYSRILIGRTSSLLSLLTTASAPIKFFASIIQHTTLVEIKTLSTLVLVLILWHFPLLLRPIQLTMDAMRTPIYVPGL